MFFFMYWCFQWIVCMYHECVDGIQFFYTLFTTTANITRQVQERERNNEECKKESEEVKQRSRVRRAKKWMCGCLTCQEDENVNG